MNGSENNREASDLRRHRSHYDVTVMSHLRIGYLYVIIYINVASIFKGAVVVICTFLSQYGCQGDTQPIEMMSELQLFNTLRPRQNGRHLADDIFKCIFVIENVWTLI